MKANNSKRLIIMSSDHFAAFTDEIEAKNHRHWMLQMFLTLGEPLDLQIENIPLNANWVLLDSNIEHCFFTKSELHFTMLIEPTSGLADSLRRNYFKQGEKYVVLDKNAFGTAQTACLEFLFVKKSEAYMDLVLTLYKLLNIDAKASGYDKRISELLIKLNECEYTAQSVTTLANEMYLSASRLAHLFKQETSIPLKSYLVLHKLQKAYEFILEDSISITEAAMRAGFDSPSHLAATGKALMGISVSRLLNNSEFLKVTDFIRV